MPPKPHLLFKNPKDGETNFRYSSRNLGEVAPAGNEVHSPEYHEPIIISLSDSLNRYYNQQGRRQQERNTDLQVPQSITCIEIEFHDRFDSATFDAHYRNVFGLAPLRFSNFHRTGLFTVIDEKRFNTFLSGINGLISSPDHNTPGYDTRLRFIKFFNLLTSEQIINRVKGERSVVYFSIVENAEIYQSHVLPIQKSLMQYLERRSIPYVYNDLNSNIEIPTIQDETILEIAQNFDIVHSISSSAPGIRIRPGELGQVVREYRFEVTNQQEDLPIIGVIDTGVSNETPLASLLVEVRNAFDITGGNGWTDDVNHGTGVASLAAFGERLAGNVAEKLEADAKILSIKVLSGNNGYLPNHKVLEYIRRARQEHDVRIFVLTICYEDCLEVNELTSAYAFALDKLAYELDILVCISTGNRDHDIEHCAGIYPVQFLDDVCNIKAPAESMNNITVGAIGDNFEIVPIGLSRYPLSDRGLPAIYTRKFHLSHQISEVRNRHIRKPDIVFSGGNYLTVLHPVFGPIQDSTLEAGIQFFSNDFAREGLIRSVGTSYSAPLIANLAAKILRRFPSLRMQTVKALMINGALECSSFVHTQLSQRQEQFIYGYGKPSTTKCLSSTDNEVTIVIEDNIEVGKAKSFPIYFPDYLKNHKKENSLLKIEATLCFSFLPLQYNQIAYCPVNITFGMFKNLPLYSRVSTIDENGRTQTEYHGIIGNHKKNITLNHNGYWSQDGFGKSKLLSNVQKVELNISKSNLLNENFEFKIAVGCRNHGNLSTAQANSLPASYDYSLVLRIKENLPNGKLGNSLYEELIALNQLEVLGDIEQDADLDAEA